MTCVVRLGPDGPTVWNGVPGPAVCWPRNTATELRLTPQRSDCSPDGQSPRPTSNGAVDDRQISSRQWPLSRTDTLPTRVEAAKAEDQTQLGSARDAMGVCGMAAAPKHARVHALCPARRTRRSCSPARWLRTPELRHEAFPLTTAVWGLIQTR